MLEVKLHDIGEGMTEGEVIHYLVKVGDSVMTDQPLVEVQTDKMVAELTSPCSGIVKEIRIEVGETVQVGTSLLYIEMDEAVRTKQKSQVETKQIAERKQSRQLKQMKNRRPYLLIGYLLHHTHAKLHVTTT